MDEEVSDEEYQNRLQVLKYGLKQDFNFSTHSIPEEVIDAFVKEIIVYPDCFVWKRNIQQNYTPTRSERNKFYRKKNIKFFGSFFHDIQDKEEKLRRFKISGVKRI